MKKVFGKFGIVTVALLGLLTACPQPIPTVASIDITGTPADNFLKTNAPIVFTATAKDASGNPIAGKSIAWTSSDSSIASVDASGNVSVKRIGKVTLKAGADGIEKSTAELNTYGMQMVGGTYNRSDYYPRPANYCSPGVSGPGTAFAILWQPKTGTNPGIQISVTGPTGWNNNSALAINYSANANVLSRARPAYCTPASAGTYTATATVGAESFSTSFIIDPTNVLALPSGIATSAISNSGVTGNWDAVVNAQSYSAQVYSFLDSQYKGLQKNVPINTATITGLTLVAGTHNLDVQAFNFDITTPSLTTPLPIQFNASIASKNFIVP